MHTIDWQPLIIGYNERFNTNHLTLKSMLNELYIQIASSYRMENILGVCHKTILNKLHYFKIPVQKKGGDYMSRAIIKQTFLRINPSRINAMTASNIASELGCSSGYAYSLCRKYQINFKRIKKVS